MIQENENKITICHRNHWLKNNKYTGVLFPVMRLGRELLTFICCAGLRKSLTCRWMFLQDEQKSTSQARRVQVSLFKGPAELLETEVWRRHHNISYYFDAFFVGFRKIMDG